VLRNKLRRKYYDAGLEYGGLLRQGNSTRFLRRPRRLSNRDCGQLAIAIGESDRASALCPDDAELFEKKGDELNTLAGNLCGQYDHDAMFQAALLGSKLVTDSVAKDGAQVMCGKLRAAAGVSSKSRYCTILVSALN
jgi:hypothetical protein